MTDQTRNELLNLLEDVHEFLDNYIDVEDGDYGEPRPNRAMSLDNEVARMIKKLERD